MEHYEFLFKIAEGAYGTVWKCKDKNTGRAVAVKKMKEPTPVDSEEYEFALREVQLLQMLQHENVVQLLEAYQSTSGRLYLVFEYVEQTLLGLLKASPSGRGLPHPQIKSVMWQLLQSLSFMHGKKVIHRDIKPSNILVSTAGTVKLCDFGFARPLEHDQAVADYTTYVVTRWYRAPEVLIGDAYGPAVDIWSFGCIFAELFTGRALFPGRNNNDQLWLVLTAIGRLCEQHTNILKTDSKFASFRLPLAHEYVKLEARLKDVPVEVIQLLKACLHPDPSKRLTADQLLRLPYFYDVEDVLPQEYLDSIVTRVAPDSQPAAAAEAAAPEGAGPPAAAAPLQQLQQQQQDLQQQQQDLQQQQAALQHEQAAAALQLQQQQQDVALRTRIAIAAATAAVAAAAESAVLNFPAAQDPSRKQQLLSSVFSGRQDPAQPPASQQLPSAAAAAARNLPIHTSPEPAPIPAAGRAEPEHVNGFRRPSSSGAAVLPDSARRRQQQQPQQGEAGPGAADVVPWFLEGPSQAKYLTHGELVGTLEASGTLRRSVTAPEEELQLQLRSGMILGYRGSGVVPEPTAASGGYNQRISEPTSGGAGGNGKPLPHRASETNAMRPSYVEPRPRPQPQARAFPGAAASTAAAAAQGRPQQPQQPQLFPLTGNFTGCEEPAAFSLHKGGGGGLQPTQPHSTRGQALAMSPSGSSASQLSLDELLPAAATPPLHLSTQPLAPAQAAQPLRARGGSAAPRSRRSSSDCGMLHQACYALGAGPLAPLSQQPSVPTTPPKLSAPNDGRRQSDSATGLVSHHGHQHGSGQGGLADRGSGGAAAAAAAQAATGGRRFRKAQSIDGQCLFPPDKGDAARRAWHPPNHGMPADTTPAPAPGVTPQPPGPNGAGPALPPLHSFALMPGAAAVMGSAPAAAAPPNYPPSGGGGGGASAAPASLPTPQALAAELGVKLQSGRSGSSAEHLPVIRGTVLGAGPPLGQLPTVRSNPVVTPSKATPLAAARSSPQPQPQLQLQQQPGLNGSSFLMKPYLPTLSRTSHPLAALQSQGAKLEPPAMRKKQALLQAGRKV